MSCKKTCLQSFIEAYRNLPELWNQQCQAYSNRVKKAAAYDILIEILKTVEPDATRDSVVKKINNIRSTFRKELRKVNDSKRSATDADDVYQPSLWYFNDLLFLVDQEAPDPNESLSDSKINEDSAHSMPVSAHESTPASPVSTGSAQVAQPAITTVSPVPLVPSIAPNKKRIRYMENEDDDVMILARGYAVKLRKLSPQQLLFADKMINDILFDGQMGLLSRRSSLVHPSGPTPVNEINRYPLSADSTLHTLSFSSKRRERTQSERSDAEFEQVEVKHEIEVYDDEEI